MTSRGCGARPAPLIALSGFGRASALLPYGGNTEGCARAAKTPIYCMCLAIFTRAPAIDCR